MEQSGLSFPVIMIILGVVILLFRIVKNTSKGDK